MVRGSAIPFSFKISWTQSSSPPICKQIPLIVSFRLTTHVAPDPEVGDGLAVGAGVGDGVGVGVAEGVAVGVAVGSGLSVGAALAGGSLLGEGVSLSALPKIGRAHV